MREAMLAARLSAVWVSEHVAALSLQLLRRPARWQHTFLSTPAGYVAVIAVRGEWGNGLERQQGGGETGQ